MESWLNLKSSAIAAIAACVSASLFWFGTGLHPIWPLLWLAPLPVLLIAANSGRWPAALVAMAASFAGSFNLWHYLHEVLTIPAAPLLLRSATCAAVFTIAVLWFRRLLRANANVSAMLALPTVWVTFEYIVSVTSSAGTAIGQAYSQLHFLPFLQLASITGPWGMSFILSLFPSAIAVIIHLYQQSPRRAALVAAAPVAVIGAVLLFGWVRLATPSTGQFVKVGLIASDLPENANQLKAGDATRRLFQDYASHARELISQGAKVIVMPEKLGTIDDTDRAADQVLQQLADQDGVDIVAGMVTSKSKLLFNAARVYSPHGAPMEYHKLHMLPPFESMFALGKELTLMPRASGLWGVAICKDMDFTDRAFDYGKSEIGMMLVPAWDFAVDAEFHGHIAIMRGVEDGYSVVRAAKNGSLYVSDNRGRILAETATDSASFATLAVDVPVANTPTIYQKWGDWFIWVTFGLLGLTVWMGYSKRPLKDRETSTQSQSRLTEAA